MTFIQTKYFLNAEEKGEQDKYFAQLRAEFTAEQRERMAVIWDSEESDVLQLDEECEEDIFLVSNQSLWAEPFFVRPTQGKYMLAFPNEETPEFNILENIKKLSKEKKRIIWNSDLVKWMDTFEWTLNELGYAPERGVDLGIYLAYRVGGYTRSRLCEALQEEDGAVKATITKAERFLKKHNDELLDHFFDIISGIECCGVCYRSAVRPRMVWVPQDIIDREREKQERDHFGPFLAQKTAKK